MAKYSFPNVFIGLGSDNEFVRDLQNALGVVETGVFDFLTMCYVVVHKHRNGLNHDEPIVDQNTWDSIMGTDSNQRETNTPDLDRAGEGTPAPSREGVLNRDEIIPRDERGDRADAPAPDAPNATTTGVTTATPDNRPEAVTANPDAPREDQPTITAEEQQRTNPPEMDTRLATAAEPERTEDRPNETNPSGADQEPAAEDTPKTGEAGNDNTTTPENA